MARAWIGRVFLRPGELLYAGPLGPTALHAHHAFQIVASDDPMTLVDEAGRGISCRAAVVPADAPHGRPCPTASGVLLYVDPDDAFGRRLRRVVPHSSRSQDWARAAGPLEALVLEPLPNTWAQCEALRQRMLGLLIGDAVRPRPVHPAVMRALRLVSAGLEGELSVSALARAAGVSASRLSHAFSAEVGIPLKRYILWARMQRAAEHLQRGASITDAAHGAGFADGAHMSRTFRRMFGLAPSDVAGAIEWVLPDEPGTR